MACQLFLLLLFHLIRKADFKHVPRIVFPEALALSLPGIASFSVNSPHSDQSLHVEEVSLLHFAIMLAFKQLAFLHLDSRERAGILLQLQGAWIQFQLGSGRLFEMHRATEGLHANVVNSLRRQIVEIATVRRGRIHRVKLRFLVLVRVAQLIEVLLLDLDAVDLRRVALRIEIKG